MNRLTTDEFRRLRQLIGRGLGNHFFDAFLKKVPSNEPDRVDEISKATLTATRYFTACVEELYEERFDEIVEEISYDNGWDLTKEQLDELEEGKTL